MRNIKRALWGLLVVLSILWFITEPGVFQVVGFFPLREAMIQYSGVLAIGVMSVAMILALRPRWPETWLGGLDKMYRLHKWLGISALVLSVIHWLWTQGPKWAVGLGLLARPARGERPPIENPVEQFLSSQRGTAEGLGEWAFYISVLLIALALIPRFPYWHFFKTHRLLAIVYLVLAFHSVVLMKFSDWLAPAGLATAALLVPGVYAAIVVLLRRVGAGRQVHGQIVSLKRYPGVRCLETEIELAPGWPGHMPGQFAFATSNANEGAHPYTIASAWNAADRRITFVTKALGDHTSRLADTLKTGQEVKIEGPYGCFTFEDGCPRQIWIGGGIGITPFIARMKYRAHMQASEAGWSHAQIIDLFHTTSEIDEGALAQLTADAAASNVRLHLLIDSRDGRLNGERIRKAVPEWRAASFWFCGPSGFGEALRQDFAAQGLDVEANFHQELFSMR